VAAPLAPMRGPFLRTAVVALLAGALGAYVFLVENKKPADKDEKKKEKVFALDKAKARELSLQPSAGEAVTLKKDGDKWKLTVPREAPADANEVDSVLTALEGLEQDEVVDENAADLKAFGLASPKTSISVVQEGKPQPETLLLGEKTPDGGAIYAKTPARPRVFTIASWHESSFNKKPFDLRDRDLLKLKRDAVKALEIGGAGESYALEKSEKGEWAFTRPLKTLAGRWSVDGLLGTLESLRMESVAAEDAGKDLKRYGLDRPQRTVKLTLADGGYKILEIGGAAGDKKSHAREASSALVAVIANAVVDDLAKGMKELRAKRLADVATFDVEGVDVDAEGKKTTLARSTSKDKDGVEQQAWKKSAPEKKDLDKSKVEDALFKLTGLEVQEFVDKPQAAAAYGLDAPQLRVTLRLSGGKPPATLELGRKDAAFYSRRPGDDAVLKLDAAKVEEVLKALKEL
jgi:hypothetical protein